MTMLAAFPITRRLEGLKFVIDTCLVNTKAKNSHMNAFEKWERDGIITAYSTKGLWEETRGTPFYKKATGRSSLHAKSCDESENERLRQRIQEIVFPQGTKSPNDRVDVEAIRVSKVWGAIFVTNDGASRRQPGGILGARDRLHQEIGVQIMRAQEAAELIKRRIVGRDDLEAWAAARENRPLAEWYQKD